MRNDAMTINATPISRVRFARPEGTVLLQDIAREGWGTTVSADRLGAQGRVAAIAGGFVIAPSTKRYMDVARVRTGEPPV
jgi:hypothetical protein